ncbi:alpha/beta hydrolase, partial [Bradyrhizobium oligotrophicum]
DHSRRVHQDGSSRRFFTMGKLLDQANVAARDIGAWLKQLDR